MAHDYRMQILENHLDSFGHVNNATYANLFEQARWEMVTSRGFGLKKVWELQKGPIILEMKIRFKAELLLRESIRIHSYVDHPERKVHRIFQTIYKEDETIACEGEFLAGFFDMKTRQLVAPNQEWRVAVGQKS